MFNYAQYVAASLEFLWDMLDLGAYRYDVTISTRAVLEDHPTANARVEVDVRYGNVDLIVSSDIAEPEELFRVLVHECFHVKVAALADVTEALAGELPEATRNLIERLAVTAEE